MPHGFVAIPGGNNYGLPVQLRVLAAAVADGVITWADIGDVARTMADQAARVRRYGLYHPTRNPTGAAAPSRTAPHIKRPSAIDINSLNGAVYRLDRWFARHGERLLRTVATEAWHRDTPDGMATWERMDRKVGDPLRRYPADERRWIREHDRLKRKRSRTPWRRRRLRVLERHMTARRKRIWRAAQTKGGWDAQLRRARYDSLRART